MKPITIFKGNVFTTTFCGDVVVLKYNSCSSILIKFNDNITMLVDSSALRKGNCKNPNQPHILGVGFFGQGSYSCLQHPKVYAIWRMMLERCYSKNNIISNPSYIGCTVSKKWHNFQNFAADYFKMSGSNKLQWHLDKDLLQKGNKVYSKEKCCLVPSEINTLLCKSFSSRGDLPIGVSLSGSKCNPYRATCNIKGKTVLLGHFPSIDEAFKNYKFAKELEIKRVTRK